MTETSPDHPHEPPDEATSPSTLRITSKPFEEHKQRAVDRAEQWADGEEVPHVVNFQDASRIQRLLTPRRLELIRNLMGDPAGSIRDLADRLDRDVRQVHDDLQLLRIPDRSLPRGRRGKKALRALRDDFDRGRTQRLGLRSV
jgi:predicted transcriptional regulator